MEKHSWKTYQDFVIEIEPAAEGRFRAEAKGLTGEARTVFALPFDDKDITIFLLQVRQQRRAPSRGRIPEPMQPSVEFGGKLYDAVLSGPVRDLFIAARQSAAQKGWGLRVRLRLQNVPQLADLPWEFLYDGRNFLALSTDLPLVHYLDLPAPPRPLKISLPLRILVTISAPNDPSLAPLDIERERRNLESALSRLTQAGQVELDFAPDASLKTLQRVLRSARSRGRPYHVWHFIGHGGFDPATQGSVLVMCDEAGAAWPVNGFQLGTLFESYPEMRLALLNSCEGARTSRADPFSGVAAALVERGIPAVIGMQFEISDAAAIAFSEEFYAALADGLPVDAALTEARRAIFFLPNWVEWATPILLMRSPNGVLFNIQSRSRPARLSEKQTDAEDDWQEKAGADLIGPPAATQAEDHAAERAEQERRAAQAERDHLAARKAEEARAAAAAGSGQAVPATEKLLPTPDPSSSSAVPIVPAGKRRVWFAAGLMVAIAGVTLLLGFLASQARNSARQPAQSRDAVMALVPAGEFMMGSENGDTDERPVRRVFLDAFYMDTYEVTNTQFAEFLNDQGNQQEGGATWLNVQGSYARVHQSGGTWQADSGYADHPVIAITWFGAQAFCDWRGARLPSEAEWEKAARGGLEGKIYPWGDEAPACQKGAANGAQYDPCDDGTVAIGSFAPNGYGLYDMAGNVWEWVADWYAGNYSSGSPESNPVGPSTGQYRVLRGGSWRNHVSNLRVPSRNWGDPASAYDYLGFRCARSP